MRFEHDQDEWANSEGGQRQAEHEVVLFDSNAVAPDTIGGDALRFHGARATDSDDAIDEFNALRRVQVGMNDLIDAAGKNYGEDPVYGRADCVWMLI